MSKISWTTLPILLLLFFIPQCEKQGAEDESIVEGIDFDEFFAPATQAEIQSVENDWLTREISALDYEVHFDSTIQMISTAMDLKIISHSVDGNTHYAAVMSPAPAPTDKLPLFIYNHGGDAGLSVDEFIQVVGAICDSSDQFVFAAPSFRSEPLVFAGATYQSTGDPSPWDRDVDDALSLIEVVLANEPLADAGRIGVWGFSRGSCVAMLMAIRDPRIERVVEFFGPTDFLGEYVQGIMRSLLTGELDDISGLDYLDETTIQPLKNGTVTIPEARLEFIRRSPVYFIDRLPALQVHHGTADPVVLVSQAETLIQVMSAAGRGEPDFQYYLYDGGSHHPYSLPGSLPRAAGFMMQLTRVALAKL